MRAAHCVFMRVRAETEALFASVHKRRTWIWEDVSVPIWVQVQDWFWCVGTIWGRNYVRNQTHNRVRCAVVPSSLLSCGQKRVSADFLKSNEIIWGVFSLHHHHHQFIFWLFSPLIEDQQREQQLYFTLFHPPSLPPSHTLIWSLWTFWGNNKHPQQSRNQRCRLLNNKFDKKIENYKSKKVL